MVYLKGAIKASNPETFVTLCDLDCAVPVIGELEYVVGQKQVGNDTRLFLGPADEMTGYTEIARFKVRSENDAHSMFATVVARTFRNVDTSQYAGFVR